MGFAAFFYAFQLDSSQNFLAFFPMDAMKHARLKPKPSLQ